MFESFRENARQTAELFCVSFIQNIESEITPVKFLALKEC